MTAGIEITNDSGVVLLESNRLIPALLAKNSTPSGTLFTADGAGGTTYAFGNPSAGSSYGMQVFDASGALMFDAATYGRSARVVGVMQGNIQATDSQTITQIFAAGRAYAAWIFQPVSPFRVRGVSITVGGAVNYGYSLDDQEVYASISGATVSITATRTNSDTVNGLGSSVPYDSAGSPFWRALILDVTGY